MMKLLLVITFLVAAVKAPSPPDKVNEERALKNWPKLAKGLYHKAFSWVKENQPKAFKQFNKWKNIFGEDTVTDFIERLGKTTGIRKGIRKKLSANRGRMSDDQFGKYLWNKSKQLWQKNRKDNPMWGQLDPFFQKKRVNERALKHWPKWAKGLYHKAHSWVKENQPKAFKQFNEWKDIFGEDAVTDFIQGLFKGKMTDLEKLSQNMGNMGSMSHHQFGKLLWNKSKQHWQKNRKDNAMWGQLDPFFEEKRGF